MKTTKMKMPLKYYFDELFYMKWLDNSGYCVIRKSTGEILARDVWSFGWRETWGIRKANALYVEKVQTEAEKVMLIKR